MSRRPIILIGDIGVGKTMFQRYLIRVEAASLFERSIALYVNLGSQANLSLDLRLFLLQEMERQLLHDHEIDINAASFVIAVYDLDLQRFDRSYYGTLAKTNPQLYEQKKIEQIETCLSDKSEQLRRSLVHIANGRRQQIVIFLDNADQRDYPFQEQVFLVAQELAANWPAMVFLPIRPETFHHSKQKDAVSGYHAKAYTIGPPRIDLVVEKRLKFALQIADGVIPYTFATHNNIFAKASSIASLIRAFLQSAQENRELLELLDNISNGNVRMALDLVQQFFGSGHVDTAKIVEIFNREGSYTIPIHEFIRGIMYGDGAYYAPGRSPFVNLFDLHLPDPRKHFLLSLVVGAVQALKNAGASEGFVDIGVVYQRLQKLGYTPEQIETAVSRGCKLQLIEAPARRMPENSDDMPQVLRVTAAGVYHIRNLCELFAYHDAIVVDVPILDLPTRREIKLVTALDDRLQRVELLRTYFDRCFATLPPNDFFDWASVSKALHDDMVRVQQSAKGRADRPRSAQHYRRDS